MASGKTPKVVPDKDPMTVGLQRHRRVGGVNLPPFLEEYGGWILAVFALLVIFVPLELLSRRDQGNVFVPTAALRVVSGPTKKWVEGSASEIESISVEVDNAGPQTANDVVVQVTVRSSTFPLPGPTTIEAGKRAVFFGTTRLNIMGQDALSVQLMCSNCPQPAPPPAQ